MARTQVEAPHGALRDEAAVVVQAFTDAVTPRMVERLGHMAEPAVEALDILASPDFVRLLRALQKAAPALAAVLEDLGRVELGSERGTFTTRVGEAVAAGSAAVGGTRSDVSLGEMVGMARQDPGMGMMLRFLSGFARHMWEERPSKGDVEG